MRIYTSRYGNRKLARRTDLVKVGVTRGQPKFPISYEVVDNVWLLAPAGKLFDMYDATEFIPAYVAQLEKHGVDKIRYVLNKISEKNGGKDLVLLCFEDVRLNDDGETYRNWCHRRVFADWWFSKTNEVIDELENIESHDPQCGCSQGMKQLRLF